MSQKNDVLIIGAGVIGLACAYELSKRGVGVTVMDQSEPGHGCSYGNAGWLTPSLAKPLPMPGMILKSMKWLFDPVSPLYIKPEPSMLLMRWLCRFLYSTRTSTAHRALGTLAEITRYSFFEFTNLTRELGSGFGFDQKGLMMICQTPEGLKQAVHEMHLMAQHGIPGQAYSEAELKQLEPALTGPLEGGVYYTEEAHCEPLSVVQALIEGAKKNGAKIISNVEAFDFKISDRKIQAVRTTRGWYEGENVILATGSWSHAIANLLKIRLPILGGKGYAISLNTLNPSPKIPFMIAERKIAVTPRKGGIRLAGTLEVVNQDFSISPRRVDAILQGSRECINVPQNPEIRELWRGLRPCTPDGVPVIGFTKEYSNLFLATGHQMMGLKTAPATAKLTADLITRVRPTFDPKPFRADRF